MTISMLIFGVLTVISGLGVVLAPKTIHSALFLILTLFLVAVHFALLDAHFIAALQVMVYAGAIMVLVVFVIMLLGLDEQVVNRPLEASKYFGAVVSAALGGLLIAASVMGGAGSSSWERALASGSSVGHGTAAEVGKLLFTKLLYPFEVTSVLLLAAIIGAVILAHDRRTPLPAGRGLRAKQQEIGTARKETPVDGNH